MTMIMISQDHVVVVGMWVIRLAQGLLTADFVTGS